MSLEVEGRIEKFIDVQKGTSKAGKEWAKQQFIVKTKDEYNNLYCFEVFGDEKVENLTKYQKVGDDVKVVFNVQTNEWQDKYFTSLSAWRIEKTNSDTPPPLQTIPASEVKTDEANDLPF